MPTIVCAICTGASFGRSGLGFRLRLDLDVQQGRLVGRRIRKGRFHGRCLGVLDCLKILVDRHRWRLGVLIDDELYSGLRHFNRYGINDHGITLLAKICHARIYAL